MGGTQEGSGKHASHGETTRGALPNSSNLNANTSGADDKPYSNFRPPRVHEDAKFLSLINCDKGL